MQTKPIPATGESLPVIGCGTYLGFDVAPKALPASDLSNVVGTLFSAGGSVLDSSPMYGKAEAAVGALLDTGSMRRKAFLATKVWTHGREAGIRQMEESFALLRTEQIDLMQIHNLVDWKAHLPTLRDWKAEGRIRYLGVSHYTSSAYGDLEAVMRAETLDFVQLNYSVADRLAEERLLPLAAERGIAVLVNVPFGSGSVLRGLRGQALPAWAADIGCSTWPQLLLKFAVSHPSVTCAIPGTGDAAHMADNAAAGEGPMLDRATRERVVEAYERGAR